MWIEGEKSSCIDISAAAAPRVGLLASASSIDPVFESSKAVKLTSRSVGGLLTESFFELRKRRRRRRAFFSAARSDSQSGPLFSRSLHLHG